MWPGKLAWSRRWTEATTVGVERPALSLWKEARRWGRPSAAGDIGNAEVGAVDGGAGGVGEDAVGEVDGGVRAEAGAVDEDDGDLGAPGVGAGRAEDQAAHVGPGSGGEGVGGLLDEDDISVGSVAPQDRDAGRHLVLVQCVVERLLERLPGLRGDGG